jgi:uncharacterized protein involved in high-affinity Fe2+ transport
MTATTAALALAAAANAACIAREIPDDHADHLREIGNFYNLSAVAVALAEVELSPEGQDLWETRSWEETCAVIAKHLAEKRTPFTGAALRKHLKLKAIRAKSPRK